MKTMIIMLGLTLGGVSLVQASSNYTANMAVKPEDQAIIVKATMPEFTLRLKANPTTGYRWTVKQYDTRLLTLVKNEFLAPKRNRLGAGGIELWTFKVNVVAFAVPTTTTVTMEYARPWEKRAGTVLSFTIITKPSSWR